MDPWKNAYQYQLDPNKHLARIYPNGEDGRSGGMGNDDDDIDNCDKEKKWVKRYEKMKRTKEFRKRLTCWFFIILIILIAYLINRLNKNEKGNDP